MADTVLKQLEQLVERSDKKLHLSSLMIHYQVLQRENRYTDKETMKHLEYHYRTMLTKDTDKKQ
jgi:hypothetical protein